LEKELVLRSYGAEVIRAPEYVAPDDPNHYINVGKKIAKQDGFFMPNQYFNLANINAHYATTGPEIWRDTDGKVTHFVAGMGTGGTISGTAKFLKEKNSSIQVIGVDPEGSLLHHYFNHTEGEAYPYLVEGPGEDFMPGAIDFTVIDKVIVVSDKNAFLTARTLVKDEGIFAGGSSGMAVYASLALAKQLTEKDVIVVVLPDSGRNYVSKMYNDAWMKENKFL
jgi:cystathionine beta-synthase